jgi:hypothetical protein
MRDKASRGWLRPWLAIAALAAVPALAGGAAGCKDEAAKPTDQPEVAVTATPVKEVAPSGALGKLEAPESVMVYGGIDSPEKLAGHASELIFGSDARGAMQLQGAVGALAIRYGLSDGTALDPKKSVRFAVVDPKAHKEPIVVAVGISGRDAFIKTLPAKAVKDDGGNAYGYTTGASTPVFVNFVDDWAVFSNTKEIFPQHKAFMVKLIGATVDSDAAVVVDVAHLSKAYATDFEAALARAKTELESNASAIPIGSPSGVGKILDWAATVAKDLDRVLVSTSASAEGGKLSLAFSPKAGTDLAKTFQALGPRKLDAMLAKLPADAPLALVASFDTSTTSDLMRTIAAWSLQLSLGQGAAAADYSKAMNDYWQAASGDTALAAHAFDGKLRLSLLTGVKDAEAMKKALVAMRAMYGEEGVKKLYEKMGIKLEHKAGAYKVGDVSVDTVTATLLEPKPTSPNAPKDKPQVDLKRAMGAGAGIFAELMSHHTAIGKDTAFMVYGAESKKTMEAWLGNTIGGGLDREPGIQRAVKNAAPGLFFLLYGAPLAVAGALEKGTTVGPVKEGIAISAGGDGGMLHLVIDVPGGQAKDLVRMVSGLRGLF